ncbi:hypothetical protein ACIBEJ_06325 [Nonomuraea sp. NPDC050790]
MAVKTPGSSRRRPAIAKILLATIIAWIILLTVLILLDPAGAGPAP